MHTFFINRPIFAVVISLLISISGILAIRILPLEQYPDVSAPTINIKAVYTGADAQTVENTVVQVIEQGLTGLDGLLYVSSTSSSSESAEIKVVFKQGVDADTAQMQVQNKVQQLTSKLPEAVRRSGVRVTKGQPDMLIVVVVYDETNQSTTFDVADFMISNMEDSLSRIDGVGALQLFGKQYAMRIWLDPNKLFSYNLMPSDIQKAVQEQNVQVSIGKIGESPAPPQHRLNATVTAQSLLQTPQEFKNIIIKSEPNGAVVRLGDVAQVEMGSESYNFITSHNGHPAAAMAVKPAPGANALNTINSVKEYMLQIKPLLPEGYDIAYYSDSSVFIKSSLKKVMSSFVEAIVLVIIVILLFLGNFRATFIPAITVPVVLLGTFAVLAALGYTINILTLFAMILAIGLLVDDTIIVVENAERIINEKKLTAKEAAELSMKEISGSLIGITASLSVVFIPMAFFGSSSGIIYRQFSVTVITAMTLSLFVAFTLAPALCALLLSPHKSQNKLLLKFDEICNRYAQMVKTFLKHPLCWGCVYLLIIILSIIIYIRIPTGFLPNEDQNWAMTLFTLPEGADAQRTSKVAQEIRNYFITQEKDAVDSVVTVVGASFFGQGQNVGMAFIALKDLEERRDKKNSIDAFVNRSYKGLASVKDAQIFTVQPPAIMGLGMSDGFELQLQAAPGMTREDFLEMKNKFINSANQNQRLRGVRTSNALNAPQLHIDFDKEKAFAHSVSLTDVYNTINAAWSGVYINDFLDRSRIKKVYMQSEGEYRSRPEDLSAWNVRNAYGEMLPIAEIASTKWINGPETLERYNGIAAYEIAGKPANGLSSGQAIKEIENIAKELGVAYSWSGSSLQEKEAGGKAMAMYGFTILIIFLCLAALYESWSIPLAVLMVIPLGILGTVFATWLRGLDNNIYFQIALLTTMGLSSRNAIMMITFMSDAVKNGSGIMSAALEGAVLRFRPILMTAISFIAGVILLAISTGVGANSRIAIGTAITGGTLISTALSLFFVPLFFIMVHKIFHKK
ncbi:multidrug efflux pump [Elusimicrobium posterum]|uniref:multidrug efflux RND transporter permease subunit n=1 Tax=Elusimicrobium posterum TaxID=3116653 RepID=UPI003C73D7CC